MIDKNLLEDLTNIGAILKGHFILSSGLHSDTYIQCAKIFSNGKLSLKICTNLAKEIESKVKDFDIVISPALGGIIVGYEIGKYFNLSYAFCERVNGEFQLRRGFEIPDNSKILIVEDIVTTGKSSLEVVNCLKSINDTVSISAIACIINRMDKNLEIDIPIISLMKLQIKTYTENNIPESLTSLKAVKPGSRWNNKKPS